MTTKAYDDDEMELLAAVGESTLAWNALESTMRLAMYGLGGRSEAIDVFTAGLNAASLCSTMKVMVREFAASEMEEPLLHACSLFDRLRDLRNEYTHGPMYLARTNDGVSVLLSQSVAAKKRLTLYQGDIEIEVIHEFTASVNATQFYLGQLIAHMWGVKSPTVPPIDQLAKPTLPSPIAKVGHHMVQKPAANTP